MRADPMRRYAPFIALGIVTLSIAAAALAYFLPTLSLSLVPILVIFIFFQRYLVQGIATTGLKG